MMAYRFSYDGRSRLIAGQVVLSHGILRSEEKVLLAGMWYNTTYHSSLKTTSYQALCGNPPPTISEVSVLGPENA